jgi:hypothetical protein
MTGTVAKLLHYFPQYTLAALETMPAQEFLFLLAGMLDVTDPGSTEPQTEAAARMTREAHDRAVQAAQARARRR